MRETLRRMSSGLACTATIAGLVLPAVVRRPELSVRPAKHVCEGVPGRTLYSAAFAIALTGVNTGVPLEPLRRDDYTAGTVQAVTAAVEAGGMPNVETGQYEPFELLDRYDAPGYISPASSASWKFQNDITATLMDKGLLLDTSYTMSGFGDPVRGITGPTPYDAIVNDTRGIVTVTVTGQDCGQEILDPR